MSRDQIQLKLKLKLKHRENFRSKYIIPALKDGFIEMTIPDAPTNENQKYRITKKGKMVLK